MPIDEKASRGRSGPARPHSPSALVAFTACVHSSELERAAAAKLVRRPHYPNSGLDGLIQRGREHEQAHLEGLRAEGLDIVEIPARDLHTTESLAEASRLTADAMTQGKAVIYQATFLQTDGVSTWRGHADFLRRVDTPSKLGSWSYEPWDTKLARVAKASALLQLCVYAELLYRVQGVSPEQVHLILGGPGRPLATYRLASIAPYYRQVRKQFLARVAAGQPAVFPVDDPYPDPVEHCGVCDWSPLCEKRWRDDDHVSLVAGITRNQRKTLRERGITTLTNLSKLALPLSPPLERTSPVSVARIREQARVQREGREQAKPVWELILPADAEQAKRGNAVSSTAVAGVAAIERGMGLAALPAPSPGDLFFDIEGDPFVGDRGREYLFGLVGLGQGPDGAASRDGRYDAFWSFDAAGEQKMFETVVDVIHERLLRNPDLHIYHFAPYETAALTRLAGRLGTRVDEVDDLLRREIFVDLYRVVRQGIRASVGSYSIKKLEPFYSFKREMDLRLAGDARAELELWLESGQAERLGDHDEICRRIEAYNREDCLSAWTLRDWLEERRSDLEEVLGVAVPRPTTPVRETTVEANELKARIALAKERLTTDVPAEISERSPEQQGRWLLAQLLEWHAREDKSTWWDFFRMRDLSDQEIVEDPKPLGGISYEGPVGPIKRSTIHRYRFFEQEHDLGAGDECVMREPGLGQPSDPDKALRTLKIHALDDVGCTFDITVGKGRPAPHIGALIPKMTVKTNDHRARLLEIAEWVAGSRIDAPGEHHLARDLLLRVPPRSSSDNPEAGKLAASLVRPGETAQDASVRLVLELAGSKRGAALPIQGPPGSGKTHTGGEMLLALVDAGFKVGVTGPSHKVISNLLAKACSLARQRGRTLAIGQKPGQDGGALEDPFVAIIDDHASMSAVLQHGQSQVAAGTTWLWAHPAMAGSVDVLLVDEAGQMSLANAVAIAHAARNLAFLGDPRQLDQPRKGVHPEGAEVSVLEHLSPGTYTIPPDRGLFLDRTRRLHPELCRFTSEMFYEGRLSSLDGTERQVLRAAAPLGGAGIRWWPVEHQGNQNESPEEVAAVKDLFAMLLDGKAQWTDSAGTTRHLGIGDILVVAPYNAQVRALIAALPDGAKVGTVDKFQGQEAPVSIYSMTSSTPEDAPRGMEFLYSLNRLNVATSRANSVAIVVASPALLRPVCKTPRQMMQASGVCAVADTAPTGDPR